MRSIAITCGVVLIAVFAATPQASAWGGGPHFGFGVSIAPGPYYYPGYAYPYAYPYPYSYYPYGYSSPYYYGAAAAPAPSAYSQSTYATSQPTLANPQSQQAYRTNGTLDVRLPDPQGEVWVDGQRVGGAGLVRTYRERTAQGNDHVYKVTAAWHENGQLMTEERLVGVANGQKSIVDFTRREGSASNVPPPLPQPYQPR